MQAFATYVNDNTVLPRVIAGVLASKEIIIGLCLLALGKVICRGVFMKTIRLKYINSFSSFLTSRIWKRFYPSCSQLCPWSWWWSFVTSPECWCGFWRCLWSSDPSVTVKTLQAHSNRKCPAAARCLSETVPCSPGGTGVLWWLYVDHKKAHDSGTLSAFGKQVASDNVKALMVYAIVATVFTVGLAVNAVQ